jgi:hypothetical protein
MFPLVRHKPKSSGEIPRLDKQTVLFTSGSYSKYPSVNQRHKMSQTRRCGITAKPGLVNSERLWQISPGQKIRTYRYANR